MKLSVIIPTHNRPEHVERQSLKFRKYEDIEVIFIENNSTKENIRKYKKIKLSKNQEIYFLISNHSGPGQPRNFGLSKAKGEYVFFLDDDDFIYDKFLQFVLRKKRLPSVSRFSFIDGKHTATPGKTRYSHKFSKFDAVSPASFLLKREFIEMHKIKFEEGIINEDNFFASMIYRIEKKQRIYKISTIFYNTETESIMRTGKKESIERELNTLRVWENLNSDKYDISFAYPLFYWNLWKRMDNFIETEEKVFEELRRYFISNIDKKNIYDELPLLYKFSFKKIKRKIYSKIEIEIN